MAESLEDKIIIVGVNMAVTDADKKKFYAILANGEGDPYGIKLRSLIEENNYQLEGTPLQLVRLANACGKAGLDVIFHSAY